MAAGLAVVAAGFAIVAFADVIPLLCLGAATVALGQVFLLGPPYAVVAGLADDGSRAGYLAAYGTSWGIAQTLGPLASTHLLSAGVPVAWLTGAVLCLLLAALMPFASRAVTKAGEVPQQIPWAGGRDSLGYGHPDDALAWRPAVSRTAALAADGFCSARCGGSRPGGLVTARRARP